MNSDLVNVLFQFESSTSAEERKACIDALWNQYRYRVNGVGGYSEPLPPQLQPNAQCYIAFDSDAAAEECAGRIGQIQSIESNSVTIETPGEPA